MLYETERGDISIAVAGDAMISRRMRAFEEPSFQKLVEIVRRADVSIANLEMLFHDYESSWEWRHGTYTRSEPRNLDELKWMGFNAVSTANNHAFDYSEGGFLATLRYLEQYDIPHAGGGRDLDHARAPGYVDSARGRVALMSATSTYAEFSRAGPGRPDFPGRPGINALRTSSVNYVTREVFDAMNKAYRELGYQAEAEARARFGFMGRAKPVDKNTTLNFMGEEFRLADEFRVETTLNKEDVAGIERWIRGAKKQADWLVYGLHTHESGTAGEFHGSSRTSPPDFMVDFAHWTIDQGCDVFAGHGPHFLRGIEIYKGKPIFYSLGNFIMQNETISWVPAEGYRRFGLGNEHTPGDYLHERTSGGTRGHPADPVIWESVLPVCTYRNHALHEVRLYPLDLGFGRPIAQRGRPMLAQGDVAHRILTWLRDLSKPFGTEIRIEGEVGIISC